MQGPPAADDDKPEPPRVPRPSGRWAVQLLGGLHLRNGDLLLPRVADRAVRLLLARLLLAPRVSHGRDSLARALWPEIPGPGGTEADDADEVRRERLRKVLSKARLPFRAGPIPGVDPFIADRDTVRLNAEAFEVDVWRFEQLVAQRRWDAARQAYAGELVPGLDDEWVDQQRNRLAAARARCDGDAPEPASDDAGSAPAPVPSVVVPYDTRFYGRELEQERLRQALDANRLVALTGPGGCGKTRLAQETARALHGFSPVVSVFLADCRAADHVLDALRAALGLAAAARPAIDQVAERLEGRRTLLLLDNFEQLVGPGADAVLDQLLQRLPGAVLLLTSRRALRRADEARIELPPLPVPAADADLASAASNPSVALFVNRACAARADFTLNPRNLPGVLALCRLLEGLPLALELAAARIRSHRPHEMVQALQHGLKLLARPQLRAGLVGRQLSLEAALAWSWELLSEPQRDLLRHLSAFRGGFTVAQAQALAPGPDRAAELDALAADSLVHAPRGSEGGGPSRLALLAVVREFVVAGVPPPQARLLRHRHRELFLAHVHRLQAQGAWPDDADMPNLAQALDTAIADGEPATALALARALATPWRARGAPQQVLELLPQLAQAEALPAAHRVGLLTLLSTMLLHGARSQDAHVQVVQALQLAGDDPLLRAEACLAQADVHWRAGRSEDDADRALALTRQAEALLDGLDPADRAVMRLQARLLMTQGAITLQHGRDVDAAARRFERAERLFSVLGDRHAAVQALPGRTACLLAQARWREVVTVASRGEQLAAELGDVMTQLQLGDRLSNALDALQQHERALQVCQRQTRLARRHGMHYFAAYAMWNQCHPLARLNQPEGAARLLAFVCRYWVQHFGPLSRDDLAYVRQVRQLVRTRLGLAGLRAAWTRGQALSLRDALELAAGAPPARPGPVPHI